jgi:YD repeat-containing protein
VRMRVTILTSLVLLAVGLIVGGPLSSGSWLLLVPPFRSSINHPLPASYQPLHKGSIDYATGAFVRLDEDLALQGTPPFVLTRTYQSRDSAVRQFGVGATHNGEWQLVGDRSRFQWMHLLLENSMRVHFDRLSPGVLFFNALFDHRTTPTEFAGAKLGWVGLAWALKWQEGRLAIFKTCRATTACALTWLRDEDGHWIRFAREGSGALRQIITRLQRIDLEYDDARRVRLATSTTGRSVSYSYDGQGRLTRAASSNGVVRSYTYGANGEMLTVDEPGRRTENTYENGRCVRQVTRTRSSDGTERVHSVRVFYSVRSNAVQAADVVENESYRMRFEFTNGYPVSETYDDGRGNPTQVTLERDPVTQTVTSVTVSCTGPKGPAEATAPAANLDPDAVKASLFKQICS